MKTDPPKAFFSAKPILHTNWHSDDAQWVHISQWRVLRKENAELLEALKREHIRPIPGHSYDGADCPVCQSIRRAEGD